MKTTGDYIIHGGMDGKTRLNVLSEALYKTTLSLLERNGIREGISFLDVGCGGGNVSLMVAEMVGSTGSVTALDFDEEIIQLARKDAADKGLANVSFRAMSAYDIEFNSEFDAAYSRFLLSHLHEPERVLQHMLRSVKPGGRVIVEDVQFSGHFCYPASEAFNEYVRLYTALAYNNSQHPELGPALFSLFHAAGIKDVGFEVVQPSFNTGSGKWMAWLTLDRIRETLISQGLADVDTVNRLLGELEVFTKDEGTIISLPRIFRVWGVK